MKRLIISSAIILLNSNSFANYGSNTGYSTTKKINIENNQWVLLSYTGGREVNLSSERVSAQSAISDSSSYDGNISYPTTWNYGGNMVVNSGTDDNATFKIEVQSSYWSQLLAHKNFSTNNIGEVAIEFVQDSSFMNLPASSSNDINSSYLMNIKLDGQNPTADTILKLHYHENYLGKIFTLLLDANESNNTSYNMTVINGTAYILNDTTNITKRPSTAELIEFNTSKSLISSDSTYTVAKFNSNGQSWMLYESNLSGESVVTDGGLKDLNGNVNRVNKGGAYWYKMNLNLDSSINDANISISIKDEDVEIDNITLADDSWNLTALPKGHIKHSQGGLILSGGSDGDTIKFIGTVGSTEDAGVNSITLNGALPLTHAKIINSFIDGKDGNGTLFEVPIRAYPINSENAILIVADTRLDFEIDSLTTLYSIGGALYSSQKGKTKLGESAIAINISDFINRIGVGSFTIEIPDLYSGFSGVEVNLSNVAQDGTATTYSSALNNLKSNIESAMYYQACLHTKGDYDINKFDSDFDGVDDSILIALKAKGERNTTADYVNPTACVDNNIIRDDYNSKYFRIGVKENTYITPYLAKLDNNYSVVSVIDSSENTYAKDIITTTSSTVSIDNYYLDSSINSSVEWNITSEADINSEGNYIYFVTNSRTLRLAESNVSEYNLANRYKIASQVDKNDVLMDIHYLSSSERKAQSWANGYDLNSSLIKGIVSNVFTLADLAQAPFISDGKLAKNPTTDDLNINTIWSVDMPSSGPLYDIVSTLGKPPARVLAFRNGSYLEINLEKTLNTSEWFDSEDLYFISAFNGYWIKTDSNMESYTINNTVTSSDSGEFLLKKAYDMSSGVTSNYIFNKWLIKNVGSNTLSNSKFFSTSMHNISIDDYNMSANFTSATSSGDKYEILIDPFTFSDFNESGFNSNRYITITNGFESSTLTSSPISYSYTKPSKPTVTGTNNNILTVTGLSGTLDVHLTYIDEANLSFSRIKSSTNSFFTIRPQDVNISSNMVNDVNETKIRFFNVANNGLSSDITTVTYPLYNVGLIDSESGELNQTEWIDADGDRYKKDQVIYDIISDDGSDGLASEVPSRYDINGTKITISASHPYLKEVNASDGVQILSLQSGKKAVLSYRPNGFTSGFLLSMDDTYMEIYDGIEDKYIARVDFNSSKYYKYSGTKWYLYSEATDKMYVGIFEDNASGGNQFVNCADNSTNCQILTTDRTLSE